jgi:large subunit ribosomal protein L9
MPANIQVILQQDVDKVGKSGELIRVRPGFARNYLLPRELALPATSAAVHRIQHERAVALARAEKVKKEAHDASAKLSAVVIQMTVKAGEDGRLFGSVTTKDIERALTAQGFPVDRRKIHLPEPIKAVGVYEVPIKLLSDVSATVKVEVIAK